MALEKVLYAILFGFACVESWNLLPFAGAHCVAVDLHFKQTVRIESDDALEGLVYIEDQLSVGVVLTLFMCLALCFGRSCLVCCGLVRCRRRPQTSRHSP